MLFCVSLIQQQKKMTNLVPDRVYLPLSPFLQWCDLVALLWTEDILFQKDKSTALLKHLKNDLESKFSFNPSLSYITSLKLLVVVQKSHSKFSQHESEHAEAIPRCSEWDWSVSCVLITKNMQVGASGHRGDAATAKRCLALIVATITDRRQTDHKPATKIPDSCIDHHAVFPPSDAHFNKRSKRERETKMMKRKGKKESKR